MVAPRATGYLRRRTCLAQVGSANRFFRPHPWLVGGHRQTIAGYWCRRLLRWTLPADDVIVEAEEDVRLLLRAAVQLVARFTPRVAVAGFSLGAGQALLALGRRLGQLPDALRAVAGVSPPLDLSVCADALARPDNRLYQHYFMAMLRETYRRRVRARPDLFEAGREGGARTVRDYDEAVTAPYGGYADADDYYARSSAGPWLAAIDRPALLLAAADDPMIPGESLTRWPLPLSGKVRREIAPTGGHVGFVGRSEAPGFFCAAPRVLDFLEEAVGT